MAEVVAAPVVEDLLDARAQLPSVLVGVVDAVRRAGVQVGPDRLLVFTDAMALLATTEVSDALRSAARATLCGSAADLDLVDEVIERIAGSRWDPGVEQVAPAESVLARGAGPVDLDVGDVAPDHRPPAAADHADPDVTDDSLEWTEVVRRADDRERLSRRDVADLDENERAQVAALVALCAPWSAVRRSRRRRRARHGSIDVARTVRACLRVGGMPVRPVRRRWRHRPRRTVFLLDVSGSMQPYAEVLICFAHALRRSAPRSSEVFTLGTRLTRVSASVGGARAASALPSAAVAVPDWNGGTRLGLLLTDFLDRWGRRGLARGAVVVLASDGWECGDASRLGAQMARLHLLAHRVVWINPHKSRPEFRPVTGGMAAALPHVDDFVTGHSLAALGEAAAVIGDA